VALSAAGVRGRTLSSATVTHGNFRRRDIGLKFSPARFAVAAVTFALSMVLVYSANGIDFGTFDGFFPIFEEEEQYQHCSQ
jgi:hypothetical protein